MTPSEEKILRTIIFSSGQRDDDEATRQKVCDVISRYLENFTLFAGRGYWKDKGEISYQLLIISEDDSLVTDLIKELKSAFNQETILEIRHAAVATALH